MGLFEPWSGTVYVAHFRSSEEVIKFDIASLSLPWMEVCQVGIVLYSF